jgi:hypothetical protein
MPNGFVVGCWRCQRRALLAGLLEHPAAEGDDQPGLLGQGDELGWEDLPACWVLPAHQRLQGGDSAAVKLHDRLVLDGELVLLDRPL